MGGTANRRTLIAIYVVMAIAVAVVSIVVISAGQDLEPEPPIAGGYDLAEPDPCLGTTFDLRQSGEFVNIENADNSLGGSLRTEQGRLTGDVSCVDDETAELQAQVADREITGTLDGRQITAELMRDPPPPGPRPQRPQVDRRRVQDQAPLGLPRRRDRDRGRRVRRSSCSEESRCSARAPTRTGSSPARSSARRSGPPRSRARQATGPSPSRSARRS